MAEHNPNAFPFVSYPNSVDFPGMYLRDWFAGQFMAAAIEHYDGFDESAKYAYKYADAMLRARKALIEKDDPI